MSKLYKYHCIRTIPQESVDSALSSLETCVNRFLASQIKPPLPLGGPCLVGNPGSYIAYQSFMGET